MVSTHPLCIGFRAQEKEHGAEFWSLIDFGLFRMKIMYYISGFDKNQFFVCIREIKSLKKFSSSQVCQSLFLFNALYLLIKKSISTLIGEADT